MSAHLDWVDARLADLGRARTGDAVEVSAREWATVLRVPTTDGDVWFKATSDALRHEAAVTRLVSARAPGRVPPFLAVDVSRGWMLMADAGRRLREVVPEERSLHRWHDVLRATARIQLDLTPEVPSLLATGLPHRPLAELPEVYDAFVITHEVDPRFREASAQVAARCDELAAYGIAETIQHDDLHDAQVFLGPDEPADGSPGTHLVLDWGDACVSHPFFTLSVSLLGVIAWGVDDEEGTEDPAPYRDSYLAPFAAAYDVPLADLRPAADLAARLGWAYRAVTMHIDGDLEATERRLRLLLDGHT